jgi:hypothetical protein
MVRIISALILAVTAFCANAEEPLKLVDNPPDRHIVVPGDTLWGISGKFLQQPWRWPEIWRMNKDEIKNPHRIYPGDIVILDTSGATPRLKLGKSKLPTNAKLQPQVYSTPISREIASIPANIIEPFISQPLIIEKDADKDSPRILATQEDRVIVSGGDTFFASGIPDASQLQWDIYRPGKPLKDPENGEILGYEAYHLGNAKLVAPGVPATLRVALSKEEIVRGDHLTPALPVHIISYSPRRPEVEIAGRVATIYGDRREGASGTVITINRGANEGVEVGHVLALFRKRITSGTDDDRRYAEEVPEERYGLVFVFRVFNRVSYALVMESSRSVLVGDAARNP